MKLTVAERAAPPISCEPPPPLAGEFPVFPVSWYLFCFTRDLGKGPFSKRFLGQRIVAYRTEAGVWSRWMRIVRTLVRTWARELWWARAFAVRFMIGRTAPWTMHQHSRPSGDSRLCPSGGVPGRRTERNDLHFQRCPSGVSVAVLCELRPDGIDTKSAIWDDARLPVVYGGGECV